MPTLTSLLVRFRLRVGFRLSRVTGLVFVTFRPFTVVCRILLDIGSLMKRSVTLVGCMTAAVSATVISSSSTTVGIKSKIKDGNKNLSVVQQGLPLTEQFAPRFDGLRFIETLVTAHR